MLACIGKSGKFFIKNLASPKSCTIMASMPYSYALLAKYTASSNSSFFIRMFKVKFVFTFLSLAYFMAFFSSSKSKFVAEALALKLDAPKYTQSAPF